MGGGGNWHHWSVRTRSRMGAGFVAEAEREPEPQKRPPLLEEKIRLRTKSEASPFLLAPSLLPGLTVDPN